MLGTGKVFKLKKFLYRLKQSPRAWFDRFTKVVKKCGYWQSQADHTLFYKYSSTDKIVILIVARELEVLKKFVAREFEIKDLGALRCFLGMEFMRSKKEIFVWKYILDLLEEIGLLGCKPVETPMEPNLRLQPTNAYKAVNQEQFQRLVRRLLYLSHTRSNIAFTVSLVSQSMHSLREFIIWESWSLVDWNLHQCWLGRKHNRSMVHIKLLYIY